MQSSQKCYFKISVILKAQDFLPKVQKIVSDVNYTPICKDKICHYSVDYLALQHTVKQQMYQIESNVSK